MEEYIKEAIQLELNMSELYVLFMNIFPEDELFWWKLASEEKNHATLLETLEDFSQTEEVKKMFKEEKLLELKELNEEIKEIIERYKNKKPDKKRAYKKALAIENESFDAHFQKTIIGKNSDNDLIAVMEKLNGDDKDHGKKILKLIMEQR